MKAMLIVTAVVFLAEIGCILRSACFVAEYGKMSVLTGTILGTAIAATIGIFIGGYMGKSLPHGLTNWIAGSILIIIGTLMIYNNHSCGGNH